MAMITESPIWVHCGALSLQRTWFEVQFSALTPSLQLPLRRRHLHGLRRGLSA